jgi:hypothetical protein
MTPTITLISAVVGATFVLAVPALGDSWGADRNQASVHVSPDRVDRAAAVQQKKLFAVLDARERSSAAGRRRVARTPVWSSTTRTTAFPHAPSTVGGERPRAQPARR